MAKVLVTGASGFLGANLTRALSQQGHDVFALVRKSSDLSELEGIACTLVYGDVTDRASLDKAFAGKEAIFHLAGLIAYKKADRQKMEIINVTGTQNVVDACLENNISRLIHMSSVVAVGASKDGEKPLDENSPFNLHALDLGYFETKLKAEKIVMEAVRTRNLDAVALNPSTIYGPGDAKKGSRSTQVKVARGKFPFYTKGGVSIVHVEDAVAAIIQAWHRGRSGERYILSGDNITIEQLFQMIAKAAQVPAPKILMPTFVLHVIGAIGDFLSLFGFSGSLSRENAWTATMYHWFDSSKARRELDFKPRPAEIAISESVRWMKSQGII